MNRPLALFFVLFGSLALCSLPVSADLSQPPGFPPDALEARPEKPRPAKVQIEKAAFYYKTDANVRYLDFKNIWQAAQRGEIEMTKAAELAKVAYEEASVEKPFEQWRYHGQPSPEVFVAKAHVYNNSPTAALNVKANITVKALVGDWRVHPTLMVTDYDYLKRSARWVPLGSKTMMIPVLSPGEEKTLSVAEFSVLKFMSDYRNQWPTRLQVEVSIPSFGQRKVASLEMIPDHFMVQTLY